MTCARMTEAMRAGTRHGFLTGRLTMATRPAVPKATAQPTALRAERYRVRFDSSQPTALYARMAGACRSVWNQRAACQGRCRMWQAYRMGLQPSLSFFTLGPRFTALCRRTLPPAVPGGCLYAGVPPCRSRPPPLPGPAPHHGGLHPGRQGAGSRVPAQAGPGVEGRHGTASPRVCPCVLRSAGRPGAAAGRHRGPGRGPQGGQGPGAR